MAVVEMRPTKYQATLVAKVDAKTRLAVEDLAFKNRMSLGEVTRELLDLGIKAKGMT